jgi:hypothetical protein
MRRKLVICVTIGVLIASLLLWRGLRTPTMKASYDEIALGMSEEELIQCIAVAPDANPFRGGVRGKEVAQGGLMHLPDKEFRIGKDGGYGYFDKGSTKPTGKFIHWQTKRFTLSVLVDGQGCVVGKHLTEYEPVGTKGDWLDEIFVVVERNAIPFMD